MLGGRSRPTGAIISSDMGNNLFGTAPSYMAIVFKPSQLWTSPESHAYNAWCVTKRFKSPKHFLAINLSVFSITADLLIMASGTPYNVWYGTVFPAISGERFATSD